MKKLLLPLVALALSTTPALAQPVITNQPANQTACPGGNITFAVGVSGDGPFTYQWQFNGTNLPASGIITTVAGKGSGSYSGDGGAATNAGLTAYSVAVDASGNLFIGDLYYSYGYIRKVGTNGIITRVAGGGYNYPGNGGAATNASFNSAPGVTVDAFGDLFIADYANHRICKVGTNGILTTVAGSGTKGYSGDGGAATNASLNYPSQVAVDFSGNVFIADSYNGRIREVNTNGIITTVAGGGTNSADGVVATNASLGPIDVAVDACGNLFIADAGSGRIRKMDTNGIITTVAGGGLGGGADGLGDCDVATNASISVHSVAVDSLGNIFIADMQNHRIREVDTNGIITTVAGNGGGSFSGDGGAACNASLWLPRDVAVDTFGNLFIADHFNLRVRKVVGTPAHSPTLPMLTVYGVSNINVGNYSVVVSDSSGSVTSSVVTLTVVFPPANFTTSSANGNQLTLQLTGKPDYPYILQSATNLTLPIDWQPIVTNPADASGNWNWTITNLSAVPGRYYRAAAQ